MFWLLGLLVFGIYGVVLYLDHRAQIRHQRWLQDQQRREWAQGIDGVRWTWPVKR